MSLLDWLLEARISLAMWRAQRADDRMDEDTALAHLAHARRLSKERSDDALERLELRRMRRVGRA